MSTYSSPIFHPAHVHCASFLFSFQHTIKYFQIIYTSDSNPINSLSQKFLDCSLHISLDVLPHLLFSSFHHFLSFSFSFPSFLISLFFLLSSQHVSLLNDFQRSARSANYPKSAEERDFQGSRAVILFVKVDGKPSKLALLLLVGPKRINTAL